jgi:hypothetical protein
MAGRPPGDSTTSGLAALAFAVVAVACCAGLPLMLALAASAGVGTMLGIGAGIVAAALLVGAVVILAVRRRGAYQTPARQERGDGAGSDRERARGVTR